MQSRSSQPVLASFGPQQSPWPQPTRASLTQSPVPMSQKSWVHGSSSAHSSSPWHPSGSQAGQPAAAASAQAWSQIVAQQKLSAVQTTSMHPASSQPNPSWASQQPLSPQSGTVSVTQTPTSQVSLVHQLSPSAQSASAKHCGSPPQTTHTLEAVSAQLASQLASQQKGSPPQTVSMH